MQSKGELTSTAQSPADLLRLVASTSNPFNIIQHRESFQRRAFEDVTINSNDSAMMMNPHNPLLLKEETEAEKVISIPRFIPR